MAELGSILLRRGTTAERLAFVPLKGEIIYDTELKQVFVGDGETYGGNTVYSDRLVVDSDGNLRAGKNLAIIIDDEGAAKSLRLPGGEKKDRPRPVEGTLRYNTNDKVIEYADGNEWFFLNKTVINGDVTELFVSLDGHDDRRYGVQRGRSWGTAFRTINMAMRLAEDIINANPQRENFVNEQQQIRTKQVLVHVASGIYEEHLPIRVPANTSIFGAGQRRCIVRPKSGEPSQSPWAKLRFWRETDDYPNGYFGHHYLTDARSEFSTPLDNQLIDIFLCNDTNWFHDFSTDNHRSFAFVLDPEGQILTKSPYPHTGACFPKSSYDINPYAVGFHGGIFADGFTGNQEFAIDSVAGDGLSMTASGFWRKPNMPTAFYADGYRYQANSADAPSTALTDATTLLEYNRQFVQEETVEYVNNTYVFDYNREKCKRDLNLILRASSYDTVLGTNYLGRFGAFAYTRPNSAYVISDQLAPTVGGLNYAKGQANTSLTANTAMQQANAANFENVIDVLQNGIGAIDDLYFPSTVYDDAKDSAKRLLLANITFIQEETISYINNQLLLGNEPYSIPFSYDKDKCRRDTGLIIDAAYFDAALGTNYNAVTAGLAYQRANSAYVLSNQNVETIGGILYAKEEAQEATSSDATTQTAVGAAFDEVVDIIQNGVVSTDTSADALIFNLPTGAPVERNYARIRIQNNKDFIAKDVSRYIVDTYPNLNFNSTKCERDVKYILDALIYDLFYGGNSATTTAASSYWEGATTQVPGQQNETADGFAHLKNIIDEILLGSTITPQTGNYNSQDISGNNATSTEVNTLVGLIAIIEDVIVNGLTVLPTVIEPDITWTTTAVQTAVNNLEAQKDTIVEATITHIDNTYNGFSYDQAKCRRDTKLLIEALIFDILFEGNLATTDFGKSYWKGITSQIPTQILQHVDAYGFIKSRLQYILGNTVITPELKQQLVTPQETLTEITTDTALVSRTENLLQDIIDVIQYGTNYAPIVEFPNLDTLLANTPPLYADELQAKLDLRDDFLNDFTSIINSTINFIDTTYASFRYDVDTCRRDVGLIIDAMVHDLTFGGETETVKAAYSYFETGSTVIAEQEAQTVDAINFARDRLLSVLTNTQVTPIQTLYSQYTDNALDGSSASTIVTELFAIITNLLTNYAAIKDAHDLILSNIEWIQDEVIAYTNTTYPSFIYNQDLCRRDTGYIVAAISNDLFGGRRKSEEAGVSYYRGASSLGDPSVAIGVQLTETLDANNHAKYLIRQVLSNEAPTQTYQSVTTQTFNNNVSVSNSLKDTADSLYDIVLDIMENGEAQKPGALPTYNISISDETVIPGSLAGRNLTMITAGNKSYVATDWTMFGNLGYGVLARNNARCELVSIFTYYCGYTYKAESGSEVRSLNGSSSNGIYALGAAGRNPFEVPIQATTVNETCFVAEADSTIVGDNALGDLQIVLRNAVDVNGNAAKLFNVMVAEVDHQGAIGVIRYEIGNFAGSKLNIRGSAQGLVAAIPDGADITIRLLQEYQIDTNQDITGLLLGAALLYDNDPNTGYRIIEITPDQLGVVNRFTIRALPTLNHISAVVSSTVTAGSTDTVPVNEINYDEDELVGRRVAFRGDIYEVIAYTGTTIQFNKNITSDFTESENFRMSPAPGDTGKIFTDFSVVKANNHDMLDVGTGSYEDSNYPRELYGPPTRPAVQSNEVTEDAPGRVFFVTNDQDGNFRVGDYFRVNQGDGSVSFSAAIALSNLDGLGFTRGVTINEFSPDADMIDVSDEAVPTEQAVVNYINRRIGQDQQGATVGANIIGPGVMMLDGSQVMTSDMDLGNNNINNVDTINSSDIQSTDLTSSNINVTTQATLASASVTDLTATRLVFVGTNGELVDDANITYNGTSLVVVSSPSSVALDVSGDVDIEGELSIIGDIAITGGVVPTADDTYDLGSEGFAWRDLYVGPGSIYVDNHPTIQKSGDGLVIQAPRDEHLNLRASGTGNIIFSQDAEFDLNLSILQNLQVDGQANLASVNIRDLNNTSVVFAGINGELETDTIFTFDKTTDSLVLDGNFDIDGTFRVDEIEMDQSSITINGNEFYATGSSASGIMYLVPGFTGANLGTVEIQGNLSVAGTVSTTDVGLANTTVNGNLTVQGNTSIGNSITDALNVEAGVNSDLIPFLDSSFDLGQIAGTTLRWRNMYIDFIDTLDIHITNNGNLEMYDNAAVKKASIEGFSGNADFKGTLTVAGNTTLAAAADFTIQDASATPVTKFFVDGATGNTTVSGNVIINGASDFTIQNSNPANVFAVDGATGDTTIAGDVSITGDLTVTGTVLNQLSVEDNILVLNYNVTGTPSSNAGIEVERGTSANVTLRWNESTDKWQITNDGTNYDNISVATEVSNSKTDSLSFNTSDGILTATRGDASTYTVDLDGRFVLDTGDTMTGALTIQPTTVPNNATTDLIYLKGVTGDVTTTPMAVGIAFEIEDGNNATNLSRIRSAAVNDTDYGDNDEAASNIIFSTTNGGTEADKMIITGRGDIGINQINPAYKLDVNGTLRAVGNADFSAGIDVTGDITVTGTVDGRDIATDGTKLDGIENNATADQTASEILAALITVDGTGTTLDADLLDGYEGSSFVNSTHTSHSAQSLAVGWYTIAINAGDRAVARFGVRDTASGRHQAIVFYAMHHFGSNSDLTLLASSKYSGDPLRYIRIKEGGTYDGAMLQIYIDDVTNTVNAYMLGDNFQSGGWTLVDWVPDGTDPGGLGNYAALTNTAAQIDINQTIAGGMVTTGPVYSGGATTQYRNLTTNDEGTGNGLDADTVDGIEGASFLRNDVDNNLTNPSNTTRFYSNDVLETSSGTQSALEVFQDTAGADAFMTFHVSGDYAGYFGLKGDINDFAVGGWSFGNNAYKVWHEGNDTGLLGKITDAYVPNSLTLTNITTGNANTAGTITGNWSLSAGSRFQATYADLAEYYTTDKEYPAGTIVMFGGDKEVTAAIGYATTKVAGVISTDPAFIMNSDGEGQAIALKGRIPVYVKGKVNKGDFIIASDEPGVGVAVSEYIGGAIIGKAIEDKITEETDLVEVKV